MRSRSQLFGIIGKPLMHSLSPAMHQAAFAALGLEGSYLRIVADDSAGALSLARTIGARGFNVTAPFKQAICELVSLHGEARHIGAANTVLLGRGRPVGLNTDAFGLVGALSAAGAPLRGRSALVLGAGGAARAAAFGLLAAGARVVLANRTEARARSVARKFACGWCSLDPEKLRPLVRGAEIVVGTVSAPVRLLQPSWLQASATVIDAVYGWETPLQRAARRRGCRLIDGREWLLYQGVRAFEEFTGERAPIDAMRKAIYRAPRPARRHLVLVGFMGAGKSTVARDIAEQGSLRLLDLDDAIERRAGRRISEIFHDEGEAEFRAREAREIRLLGRLLGNAVIATGGGAVLDPANVERLRRAGLLAWLWVGAPEALSRLGPEDRPLLAGKDRSKNAKRLLESRIDDYARACDLVISTESRAAEDVARQLSECFSEVSEL
jgi:shikimate dehydrogenase